MTEKQRKILVVDDEQTVRDFLQRTLATAGYAVITASDGLEALKKMSQFNISLVLLDIMMPGLDGFEVLDHMRQYKENTPVIMLSGIIEANTRIDTLMLGADDYITKPFSAKELLARIQVKLKRAKPTS